MMKLRESLFDIILAGFLVLSLALHFLNFFHPIDDVFSIVISIISTLPVLFSTINSLRKRKISIDLLASTALIFALIVGEWTSAIFINLMLASARIFSRYTENKSRNAIKSLLKLKPHKAKIEKGGGVVEVPIADLRSGDLVIVELGENIPIDGVVVKGGASVDQSSLTGESYPVSKLKGDRVLSSSIVVSGNLVVKAEKIGAETTFERVIKLVEQAEKGKAEISTVANKFATIYILLTLFGSLALYFFLKDLTLVLGVLLVTCADDIAVGIPLAFLASIGYAAKRGVIVKGGNFLEGLSKAKTIIVDKTGTLTAGKMKVKEVFLFNEDKEKMMKLSHIVSSVSSHPASKAVMRYLKEHDGKVEEPESFKEFPGKGVKAIYEGKEILSGKIAFFKEQNIKIKEEEMALIEREKESGFVLILIAYDNRLIGFFSLLDELRPHAKAALEDLKALGVKKIVMLTGDNEKNAEIISREVGIDEFHANLLPQEKLKYLEKYLGKKDKVVMIGDGVNDAAALRLSDIGIAMGTIGSDAAIESSDIALMKDDLLEIPEMFLLSKYTMRVVYGDLLIWGVVNLIGLFLVFARIIGPDEAAAFNFITDFLPLLNSSRLFSLHLHIRK